MTGLNGQHLLHVLYDLALTLSGETESRRLAQSFLQRLLYHTGFSCAVMVQRQEADATADQGRIVLLESIGNLTLASKVGSEVTWPEWLIVEQSELLAAIRLPPWLFPRASRYGTVLKLCLGDKRLLLVFAVAAPVGETGFVRVLEPVARRFAQAYRLCEDNERNQRRIREETQARLLRDMAPYRIEQQVSDLLEISPLPMIAVETRNGQHLAFNSLATRLFGYSVEDVPDHRTWCSRVYPDPAYRQQMRAVWEEAMPPATREQSGFGPVEASITCKDGVVRLVDFYARRVGDKILLQAVDQSGRQQLQAALRGAEELAARAEGAKASFLASMSHELHTPLNAILGHAELIETAADATPAQRDNAREILASGRNLLNMVNAVLTLSRLEAGGLQVQLEAVDLDGLVAHCVRQCEAAAARHQVAIVPEVPFAGRVRVNGDALRQILLNLLDNAIKYNRRHGTVWLKGGQIGNDQYRISVTDTGRGIDATQADELFQPFSRLGAATGSIEGSGIGLYIARRLAGLMSARIGFQSAPGFGSSFWVDLPLAEPATTAPLASAATGLSAGRVRVVVAEDHPLNQSLIKLQLEKLGQAAQIFENGSEALERWRAGGVDLILTDCNMPVMDGYTLAASIRAAEAAAGAGRRVAIVACTAIDTEEEKARCKASGMDDFLGKPVRLDDLRGILATWLPDAAAGEPPMVPIPPPARAPSQAESCLDCLDGLLGGEHYAEAQQLLATFRQSGERSLLDAIEAFRQRAADQFHQAMHKLKSSAWLVDAGDLAQQCRALEAACRAQDWATIGERLPALERDATELFRQITALSPPETEAACPVPTGNPPEYPELQGLRVLVVDDDPFIREYVGDLLRRQAVAGVYPAADGEGALRILESHQGEIDTLLCDLNMPGMDGIELIRHIGKHGFAGRLFLISGEDSRVLKTAYDLAEAHGLRVGGTLAKPFTPGRLYELLRQSRPLDETGERPGKLPEIRPQEILEGLRGNEFSIHFQPKVQADTLQLIGAEVLARWRRPSGNVPPAAFIPVAETYGLIDPLFLFVLSETMKLGSKLSRKNLRLKFAVNMSALSLGGLDIPEIVLAKATECGFEASDLILEITESGVMRDMRTALDVLTRLRLRRVGLSIDDFGTGYSSFEQLRRIPFGELKVDRAFVTGAARDPTARSILETSVEVGRKLGLTIVAEGVETAADLELVRSVGCDVIQGYYIAKPMPWPEFLAWIESRRT